MTGQTSQHWLTDRSTMPKPSTLVAAASLALLSSCAPALPARPPIAEPLARPPAAERQANPPREEPVVKLTIAERAARRDAVALQAQPTPTPSSTIPAGRDYQDG